MYSDEADKIRANPGTWYMMRAFRQPCTARNLAYHINRGSYRAFPKGEFRASVRGLTSVYVQYIGEA